MWELSETSGAPVLPRWSGGMKMIWWLAFVLAGPVSNVEAGEPAAGLRPVQLQCEYARDPLGVDVVNPRLYWKLEGEGRNRRQTAFRILASSSRDILSEDRGNLWDSGRVSSGETTQIHYEGLPLAPAQQVFWKVRVWDEEGVASPWSPSATWTMGLLREEDWEADWIVAPWDSESLLLRSEFRTRSGIRRALAFVSGLGHFEFYVNGEKIGENLLSPGWTDYDKTVLYETHEISGVLKEGPNAVGLSLGRGMYDVQRRNRFVKFEGSYGPLRAICQLYVEYEDGTRDVFGTDDSWRVDPGPITFSNVYGGEDFDSRRREDGWKQPGFEDAHWEKAVLLVRPKGRLRGFTWSAPPLQVIESIKPVSVNPIREGVDVVDLGQNASYMPRIRVSGPAGSMVRLTHAEVLFPDGTINRSTCGGNRGPAWWQYTKGTEGEETWFPQFFYAGFRYLQVERFPAEPGGDLPRLESIEGAVVHSTSKPAGDFACSNPLLNEIRTLVRWAQRSNMVSVLTDCPHREKLGWLEQYHLNGPAIRYEFDLARLFSKGMNDMSDSQLESGFVPNIAPEYVVFEGAFRAAAEWGSAFIIVPWQQYLFTGDRELLRAHYGAMKKYLDYLGSRASDFILSEGLGDWYDLGPEKPGHAQLTPPEVTATAFYYLDASLMSKIAALLGMEQDARDYEVLADSIRTAFNDRFWNASTRSYAADSQAANAIPLVMGIVPEEKRSAVLEALVNDVRKRGNSMTAGDVGFRYLLQALAQGGRSDIVYDMINQDERPGYGFMLRKGATSLTESWDANHQSSHNHFMLGHVIEWFYRDLVGIGPDPEDPGFRKVLIRPQPVEGLRWAEASYDSIRGRISVRWELENPGFLLRVSIPPNVRATVYVPAALESETIEAGAFAVRSEGARFLRRDGDREIYEVGSGRYEFRSLFPFGVEPR